VSKHNEGLIRVPESFRVEDRLIERGEKVNQKKEELRKLHLQPSF
jgi:hypothetical protein